MKLVYFDNAATTKISKNALKAMNLCYESCWGNPSSIHRIGDSAREHLEKSRRQIAHLLNCSAEEIYFTSGGSESNNQALLSAITLGKIKNKKHIIASPFEHPSVSRVLNEAEKQGFNISYLHVDSSGVVRPEEVYQLINSNTCCVTTMLVNNVIGTIQPVDEIAKICTAEDVLFHSDGVQAVGNVNVNLSDLGVDYFSASAHKFHGPKGVGFLYCRRDTIMESLIVGGYQERHKRAGTENLPSVIGMETALSECILNMGRNNKHKRDLGSHLIDEMKSIDGVRLNAGSGKRVDGIYNFYIPHIKNESLILNLNACGICVSASSACSGNKMEYNSVLEMLGNDKDGSNSIRISFSDDNTHDEIDFFISALKKIINHDVSFDYI